MTTKEINMNDNIFAYDNIYEITSRLSRRTCNCLAWEGINTLNDLIKTNKKELINIPNFGLGSLKEIISFMEKLNLSFGKTPSPETITYCMDDHYFKLEFTERECEIMIKLSEDKSIKLIEAEMGLSRTRVDQLISNTFIKINKICKVPYDRSNTYKTINAMKRIKEYYKEICDKDS